MTRARSFVYVSPSGTHDRTSLISPPATGTVISSLVGSSCGRHCTNAGTARRQPSSSSSSHAKGGRCDKPRSLCIASGQALSRATSQPCRLAACTSASGNSTSSLKITVVATLLRMLSS